MKKTIVLFVAAVFCFVLPFAAAQDQTQAQSVNDLDLVKSLTGKLGVKPEQAAGAAGAIFGLAKSKLSPEDFGKVSGSVPGMDLLLKAAPVLDSNAGGLAGLAGGAAGSASLAGSFQKLGLSPDMVTKFVPEVLTFVEGKGGAETKELLGNVLK